MVEVSDATPLDLLSISQTNSFNRSSSNIGNEFEKTYANAFICHNNAPYFGLELSKNRYALWQGNCNDWTCPRCGILRAKQEYGRIVEGCRTLSDKHDIYFITLTCRGADLSVKDADENYLRWTNKLLTACRQRAKRAKLAWHYAQVTERQKRGHPHSHVLSTWHPHDIEQGAVEKWETINGKRVKKDVPALRSKWFEKRCISAGLGNQYDISKVETVEGASRYVAKYLFKETMFTTHWHRVRYSQSFPKLPARENGKAIPLITDDDWYSFAKHAVVVKVHEDADFTFISRKLGKSDILIQMTERVKMEKNNDR